jgi:DnaD/phage-associated family protein
MYRIIQNNGDMVLVPRLLFSKLSAKGADDTRFRVALQIINTQKGDAKSIAQELKLPQEKVAAALNFWEGAGLIEEEFVPETEIIPLPPRRATMTSAEVVIAAKSDAKLGFLLKELERLFGTILGQAESNLFVTLYKQDNFEPELVLMAAMLAKNEKAQHKASYVQKILQNWRQAGINTSEDADRYLKLLSEREEREKKTAQIMGLVWDPFSRADKKKIAVWYEDYKFDFDVIETACMLAADKKTQVPYVAAMLKKWHGKGYKTSMDVNAGEENKNVRIFNENPNGVKDILADMINFEP